MIGSIGVEEPTCGFLRSKQNFSFGDALHGEDVYILCCDPSCRRSRTAVVHFFSTIGLSGSLSLIVLSFESPTISLDVSRLFAVVARAFSRPRPVDGGGIGTRTKQEDKKVDYPET